VQAVQVTQEAAQQPTRSTPATDDDSGSNTVECRIAFVPLSLANMRLHNQTTDDLRAMLARISQLEARGRTAEVRTELQRLVLSNVAITEMIPECLSRTTHAIQQQIVEHVRTRLALLHGIAQDGRTGDHHLINDVLAEAIEASDFEVSLLVKVCRRRTT
jgi:hypothetical protein